MASWWMQKCREERTASTDCCTPAHSGEEGLTLAGVYKHQYPQEVGGVKIFWERWRIVS